MARETKTAAGAAPPEALSVEEQLAAAREQITALQAELAALQEQNAALQRQLEPPTSREQLLAAKKKKRIPVFVLDPDDPYFAAVLRDFGKAGGDDPETVRRARGLVLAADDPHAQLALDSYLVRCMDEQRLAEVRAVKEKFVAWQTRH